MRLWTPVDILGAIINGAVDIYGHVWATINGSMDICGCHWWAVDIYGHVWATINGSVDTWVLSLMGLWTSMDMFGLPLMGPWTPGWRPWTCSDTINGTVDMFGIPLMSPWTWIMDIQHGYGIIGNLPEKEMTKIGYFQQILNSQMGYPLDWPWPLAPCTATALDTHSNIHGLLHILPSTYFEFLCTHSPFIPTTNFRWITHKHLYNVTYYVHNTSTIQKKWLPMLRVQKLRAAPVYPFLSLVL